VQAKAIWRKWKRSHSRVAEIAAQPGQPAFWLRVPSCKISTLTLEECDEEALHRFPAVRRLESGNLVVFAHRDLHFRTLGRIEAGDTISLEYAGRRAASYRVQSIRIIRSEEVSDAIRSSDKAETLYLLTCYPFHYIGPAPKRFLVTAIKSPR
jgi:LPXTG-site transpeptidase (sortase) family protein